jgi:CubicO group peptidase (beta-lactamase class C family)
MMSTRREFLLVSAAGGLLTALGGVARAGSEIVLTLQTSPDGLRAHLNAQIERYRIPGMQVAVVQHGRVVYRDALGLADVENSVLVTNSTVFQIASLTKAFVGVAVMQLVESGKLDLDAPASRYLQGLPAVWQVVTVGQIATHSSGLPDITSDLGTLRLVVADDAEASWEKVQTMPMKFTPGEKFSYNQTNYVILGKIIDTLSGEPFTRFIQTRQLDVVGMPRTGWGDDHDVVLHSARTYTPYLQVDGKPVHTDVLYKTYIEFPPILRTCGGLNSTAEDIANWLIALERGDLFKTKSSLTTLRTARLLNNGKPGPWGIGGWVSDRVAHPVFFGIGAGKSAFGVYTKDGLAIVVLTNLSADMWLTFLDGIATCYLPDLNSSK